MTLRSFNELMLWQPPSRRPIIGGGVLYEGDRLVIFGQPKLGKSAIALQLGICLAMGWPFLGFPVVQCKVYYVQAEIAEWALKRRVEAMTNWFSPPLSISDIWFLTAPALHLDTGTGLQHMESMIRKNKPDVVILDPKYRLMTGSSEESIKAFITNIDYLRDKCGITPIIVDHARKPLTTNRGAVMDLGGSELRGPLIEMWADGITRLSGDINTNERILSFSQMRNAPGSIPYRVLSLEQGHRFWFSVKTT